MARLVEELLGRSRLRRMCMSVLWLVVIYSALSSLLRATSKRISKVIHRDESAYHGVFELQQVRQFWRVRDSLFQSSKQQAGDFTNAFDKVELIPDFEYYYPAERIIDSLRAPVEYKNQVDEVEFGDQRVVYRHWGMAQRTCAGLRTGENDLGLTYHICMEYVTLSQYTYEVFHTSLRPPEAHQFPGQGFSRYFVITERKLGKATSGGSSFRVEIATHDDDVVSTRLLLCTVQDLFSGVYIAHCPHVGLCLHVKVLLTHTNFVAYAHPAGSYPVKPLNKLIHEDTYCVNKYSEQTVAFSGWTLYRDSNRWAWLDKGDILEYSTTRIRECLLSEAGAVLAIGDSHLRYTMDNLFVTHPDFDPHLARDHKDVNIAGVRYIWTTFAENTASILRGILKSRSQPPNALIIQAGTWDVMGDRYYEHFLNTTGRILVKGMREVARSPEWAKTTKLWINLPAFPSQLPSKNNDFVRAAANAWLRTQLRGSGFEELNAFDISAPREEQFVCLSHYSCRLHNTTYMYGQVGAVISNALVKKLC